MPPWAGSASASARAMTFEKPASLATSTCRRDGSVSPSSWVHSVIPRCATCPLATPERNATSFATGTAASARFSSGSASTYVPAAPAMPDATNWRRLISPLDLIMPQS